MKRETEAVTKAKARVLKGEKAVLAAKAENVKLSTLYKALSRDGIKLEKGYASRS